MSIRTLKSLIALAELAVEYQRYNDTDEPEDYIAIELAREEVTRRESLAKPMLPVLLEMEAEP